MNIKTLLAVLGTFLAMIASRAQNIDSLRTLLETQTEREQIETFFQISWEYIPDYPKMGLSYSRKGYILATQLGDSSGMVKNGWMFGTALVQKNDSATASS